MTRMKDRAIRLCILFLAIVAPAIACAATAVDVIELGYRHGETLLPVVENLLSVEGRVSYDRRTNAIIVIDTPERIQRVRSFVQKLDRPSESLRIHVRFDVASSESGGSVVVRGKVAAGDAQVGTGGRRRDGVTVAGETGTVRTEGRGEYFVQTLSGSPAFIRTGAAVPFHDGWRDLCRRYPSCSGGVEYRTVDTGFEVTPVVVGDKVRLAIVPRVSDMHRGMIRFTEAATELVVAPGEWVTVGGANRTADDAVAAVLQGGRRHRTENRTMSLMFEME